MMEQQAYRLAFPMRVVPSFAKLKPNEVTIGWENEDQVVAEMMFCINQGIAYDSPIDKAYKLRGLNARYRGPVVVTDPYEPTIAAALAILNGADLSGRIVRVLERHHYWGLPGIENYPEAEKIRGFVGYISPYSNLPEGPQKAVEFWQNIGNVTASEMARYVKNQLVMELTDDEYVSEAGSLEEEIGWIVASTEMPFYQMLQLYPIAILCLPGKTDGELDYMIAASEDEYHVVLQGALQNLKVAENRARSLRKLSRLNDLDNWSYSRESVALLKSPTNLVSCLKPSTILGKIHDSWAFLRPDRLRSDI